MLCAAAGRTRAVCSTANVAVPSGETSVLICLCRRFWYHQCAPVKATVQAAFDSLLDQLEAREPASQREATQRVIDICALEQALGGFTNLETRYS